ncbi:MAG: hypothetical protein ACRDKF_08490 [Actinomycetota bacterium]
MSHQLAVTAMAEVLPGRMEELRRILKTFTTGDGAAGPLAFAKIPSVHFARLFTIEETSDLEGNPLPGRLVFLSDIDAPLDKYLDDLFEAGGDALDGVFECCEGFPTTRPLTNEDRATFLRHHMVEPAAMYVNTVGRTADQVHQEAELRNAIEGFLDRPEHDFSGLGAVEVQARIRDYVESQEGMRWSRAPATKPSLAWRINEALHLVAVPLLLLILLPVLIVVLPVWIVLIRIHELRDEPSLEKPDERRVQELAALEDHVVQNQFTAIGYMKPGPVRRLTTIALLRLANYGTRHVFNRGRLTGVKTIHFARWVFLDDMKRLVFASNYDGSLESYMDDFIDKVAWGLNAIFSNGVGYPKTSWLVRGGATNEQMFKDFLRLRQLPTEFWYSAYSGLTAQNIENNAHIRAGLFANLNEREAEEWLRRL